jgi:hypothetical protein
VIAIVHSLVNYQESKTFYANISECS